MQKTIYSPEAQALQKLLRMVREEKGLYQKDLAVRLGVPRSRISDYETGERRADIGQLRQIAGALGLTLREFIDRYELLVEAEAEDLQEKPPPLQNTSAMQNDAIKVVTPLEAVRKEARLSRAVLSRSCFALETEDISRFAGVGEGGIRRLENGDSARPRARSAASLVEALNRAATLNRMVTVEDIFPYGIDDLSRNPAGRTRIPPNRPTKKRNKGQNIP